MNIILTGSTGTLGSQVLFELLKQEDIETIYLLVRERNGKSAKSRIEKILMSDEAAKNGQIEPPMPDEIEPPKTGQIEPPMPG